MGRRVSAGLGLVAVAVATAGFAVGTAPADASPSQPCINGVWPYNPYVVNCNLPPRQNRVLGAAPDAGALIAGKGNWRAECLSLYVNGGYGWYPGATLVPGYHP